MLLYPPVECNKGYLITVFQAGKMKCPECFSFNGPSWSPLKYFKFCVNEFSEIVNYRRPSACVPQFICSDGAMRHYWGFARRSKTEIGFAEFVLFLEEHFKDLHHNSDDWWRDVPLDSVNPKGEKPWGLVLQSEIEVWLDRYTHFTGEFCVREGGREEGAFKGNQEIVLMPPLRVGLKGQYLFQVSPDVEPMLLTCSVSGVRAVDYFKMWVENLECLWEQPNKGTLLVLDVDEFGTPCKWTIATSDERECISFAHPFEKVLNDYTWDRETGAFDCSDEVWLEVLEKASFSEAVYTKEAFDRWLTAGRILLNCAEETDEDDCY